MSRYCKIGAFYLDKSIAWRPISNMINKGNRTFSIHIVLPWLIASKYNLSPLLFTCSTKVTFQSANRSKERTQEVSTKRIMILEFIVDQVLFKNGSELMWIWDAIDPKTMQFLYYLYPKNHAYCRGFISNLVTVFECLDHYLQQRDIYYCPYVRISCSVLLFELMICILVPSRRVIKIKEYEYVHKPAAKPLSHGTSASTLTSHSHVP